MTVLTWIWACMLIFFVIIEACTAQLVTIWFAAGSLAALIAERLGGKLWLQLVLFIAVSGVTLAATRPLVKKFVKIKAQPTNADRIIGSDALITEPVNNVLGKGAAVVNGVTWTAVSTNGEPIDEGSGVVVDRIEGVKLYVSKK